MQRGWMAQGVRNAVRKGDPDKNIRAKMREGSEKQAAKAKQTDRMIERLEVVEEPRKEWVAADVDRGGATVGVGRRDAARGRRAARGVSRWVR